MSSELDAPNTAGRTGTEPTPDAQPWRYGCPYGHSAWYRTADDGFFCRTCEAPFEHLRDKKADGTAVPPGGEDS